VESYIESSTSDYKSTGAKKKQVHYKICKERNNSREQDSLLRRARKKERNEYLFLEMLKVDFIHT